MLDGIIGNVAVVQQLESEVEGNRLPGAILIEGPQYSGKLSLALELARVLTCSGDASRNCMCASCRSHKVLSNPDMLLLGYDNFMEEINFACNLLRRGDDGCRRSVFVRAVRKLMRRFDAVFFDDKETKFKKIKPVLDQIEEKLSLLGDDGRGTLKPKELDSVVSWCAEVVKETNFSGIPVNQIRKVTFWAHTSTAGTRKVVIMENAERMNDSARNSMLKILEEPPENCFFILLTARSGEMIPTIKSRLRSYSLKERTPLENAKVIREIFGDDACTANSIAEYFASFNPHSAEVCGAADIFYSYFSDSDDDGGKKARLKAALDSLDDDSFRLFLENVIKKGELDIKSGASFTKTARIAALSKKLNDAWLSHESLNINFRPLLDDLIFFAGEAT